MRSRKTSMYNVGGNMNGDPVTLESIAAMAKERLGKDPKMLSKLSFSGDLSNLSEEDVDKLLGLVESLQGDKSAIFDPQKRQELKRTIQSLQESIGLDMDTTKSNIFSAWDDEAGFMEKPLVAAKKMGVEKALEKIMNEELDEAPEMKFGGNLPNMGGQGGGGGNFGGNFGSGNFFGNMGGQGGGGNGNFTFGSGNFFGGNFGPDGKPLDSQGNPVSNVGGGGPFPFGGGNPFGGNFGGGNPFGGNFGGGNLFGGGGDSQGGGPNPFGDDDGDGVPNFVDNTGPNQDHDGDGIPNNQDEDWGFYGTGGGTIMDGVLQGQGGAGGPATFKDRSQIPAGFSLNKEKGGMLRKPRVYKLGGDMEDTSSDWDNPQGNGQGFSWGGGSTYGDTPTPEEMMGAMSAFEQYAPGASAQLMREYGDILSEQRAAEASAAGEGEASGGIPGLTDADMAYLDMLPPAKRMREINKLRRIQRRQDRRDRRRLRREDRKESRRAERGADKKWKDRTKEEKKETLKEALKVGALTFVNPIAGVGRLTGWFEEGGDMDKRGGFNWGGERIERPQFPAGTTSASNAAARRGRRSGADLLDPARIFDRYRPSGVQPQVFGRMTDRFDSNRENFDMPMRGADRSAVREAMREARRSGALDDMSLFDRIMYRRRLRNQGITNDPNEASIDTLGSMVGSGSKPTMGATSPRPEANQNQVYPERYLRPYMKMGGDLFRYKKMEDGGSMGDPKKKKVQVKGIESTLDMQIDDMIKQGITPEFDYSGLNESQKNALYDAEVSYLKKSGQWGSDDDEADPTQDRVLPDEPRQQNLAVQFGVQSPADMDKPAGGFNMKPVKTVSAKDQRTVNMSEGKTVTPSRSAMPNRSQREFLQMRYESSGDPNKQSSYAAGLYGISPAVMSDAAKAGVIPEGADVFDPEVNKKARDWFLDSLSKQEWIANPPKPIGEANRLARIYGAYNEGPKNFKDNLQLAKDAGIDIYGDPAGWIDAKGKGAKYDGYFFPKETRDYVRGIVLGKFDPTRVPRGYKLSN